jgi:hypothetical protein
MDNPRRRGRSQWPYFDAATRGRTASGTLNLGIRFADIRKPGGIKQLLQKIK